MAGVGRSATAPDLADLRATRRQQTFGPALSVRFNHLALVWKILLLHGAQTRLVQNATITGDAPGALSRLGTERIHGQCASLPKITQEVPVSLQACHGGQRGEPGRGGPGILLRL